MKLRHGALMRPFVTTALQPYQSTSDVEAKCILVISASGFVHKQWQIFVHDEKGQKGHVYNTN
jgi:hypothetical protein